MNTHRHDDRLDRATSARLSRLATVPVDVTGLERRLRAELGEPSRPTRPAVLRWSAWSATAAALLVVAASLFFTVGTPAPAEAAPAAMARFHVQMAEGELPVTPAANLAAIRELVAAGWDGGRSLPNLPDHLAAACCLHTIDGRRVMGILYEHDGVPVTLAVADRDDLHAPAAKPGGFVVHESGGVKMVMGHRNGRLICVMGELPAETLEQIAEAATSPAL